MSIYTTYDFEESLKAASIDPLTVKHVFAAWGKSDGGYAEWAGGFLIEVGTTVDRFAYVWGWCDTTGWGCQDGGGVEWFADMPHVEQIRLMKETLTAPGTDDEWDPHPIDLNLWLNEVLREHEGGAPDE